MRKNAPVTTYRRRTRRELLMGQSAPSGVAIVTIDSTIASGLIPGNAFAAAVTTLLSVLVTLFALAGWVRCTTDEYGVTH